MYRRNIYKRIYRIFNKGITIPHCHQGNSTKAKVFFKPIKIFMNTPASNICISHFNTKKNFIQITYILLLQKGKWRLRITRYYTIFITTRFTRSYEKSRGSKWKRTSGIDTFLKWDNKNKKQAKTAVAI